MCYRDLYEFIQDLETPVQIPAIRGKVQELLPDRRVVVMEMSLNLEVTYGFYVSHRSEDTLYYPGVHPGSTVIVLARDLEPVWRKFVELKELMHLFDDPLQSTMTAKDFEQLLAGLCDEVDPANMSPQTRSEHECMWMALSLLCPESTRTEMQQRRDDGGIADAEIATILEIPERYVINLCGSSYKRNIQYLLDNSR